jgi:hypothetical protein
MSEHAEFSPSKLAMFDACPASYQMQKDYPEQASEDAQRGTDLHAIMANREKTPLNTVNFATEDDKRACEWAEESLMSISQENWLYEKPLSLIDDDFNQLTFGTADCVCLRNDEVIIVDYKFGGSYITVEKNLQLMTYASMAMQTYNKTQAMVCIIQPMRKSMIYANYDDSLINEMIQRINHIIGRCTQSELVFCVNEYCKWCKFKDDCPVLRKQQGLILKDSSKELDVNALVKLLPACKELAKRIESYQFRAKQLLLADINSIPGWTLKSRAGMRVVEDANSVYNVLNTILSHDIIMANTTFKLGELEELYTEEFKNKNGGTKKAIKEALQKNLDPFVKRQPDSLILTENKKGE